jgi:predicted PurR-regulated permease PerM
LDLLSDECVVADPATRKRDLGYAAAIIALAIAMTAAAALAYFLADILLILFLAIVVAAALQPAHAWLSHWGVPKGLAVLLIYLLFIAGMALIGVLVGPSLLAQVNSFAASIPQQYTQFVNQLHTSSSALLQRLGSNLPSFSDLTQNLSALLPHFFANVVAFLPC